MCELAPLHARSRMGLRFERLEESLIPHLLRKAAPESDHVGWRGPS
jgi:hypothetical protein